MYQKVCLGTLAGVSVLTATGCILFAPVLPKLGELMGIGTVGGAKPGPAPEPLPLSHQPFNASFAGEHPETFDSLGWRVTNDHANGGAFFCTFENSTLISTTNGLHMAVHPADVKWGYACGEAKSNVTYQYGRFSADLQAAPHHGLVTSAFAYGEEPSGVAQEIDIELVRGQLSATAWRDGKKQQLVMPLAFDATQEVHNYAFEWTHDKITWFVDHKPVLTMTSNLPQPVPMQFMVNTWMSVPSLWAGFYIPIVKRPASQSTYQGLAYAPLDSTA